MRLKKILTRRTKVDSMLTDCECGFKIVTGLKEDIVTVCTYPFISGYFRKLAIAHKCEYANNQQDCPDFKWQTYLEKRDGLNQARRESRPAKD